MIGDGVIAESIVSFKITWKNPGKGLQPTWDQNSQEILFHSSSVYPDLLFSKAQGIATYYRYTTIDAIIAILKQIDAVIDGKLGNANEAAKQLMPGPAAPNQLGQGPPAEDQTVKPKISTEADKSEPVSPSPKDDVTNVEPPKESPNDSGTSGAYTVTVYGDKLQMLDGQVSSANIRIRHKVSANLFRKVDEEVIDNSKKIWLEVSGLGKSVRMELEDFKTADGINLLVQILPTVDLVLLASERTVTPKSEKDEDYSDKIKYLRNLRMNREEDRFTRSKRDIDASIKGTKSVKQ